MGSSQDTLRIWDVDSGVGRFLGQHPSKVQDIIFSPNGARILTASNDTILIWDISTLDAISAPIQLSSHQSIQLSFHSNGSFTPTIVDCPLSVDGRTNREKLFSSDGKTTTYGHPPEELHIFEGWICEKYSSKQLLYLPLANVNTLKGHTFASGSSHGRLIIMDLSSVWTTCMKRAEQLIL